MWLDPVESHALRKHVSKSQVACFCSLQCSRGRFGLSGPTVAIRSMSPVRQGGGMTPISWTACAC